MRFCWNTITSLCTLLSPLKSRLPHSSRLSGRPQSVQDLPSSEVSSGKRVKELQAFAVVGGDSVKYLDQKEMMLMKVLMMILIMMIVTTMIMMLTMMMMIMMLKLTN